jgi:hypothetical protein
LYELALGRLGMKKASGSKCERCIGRSKDASLGAIPLGSSDSEYNVRKRPILGNLRDGRFLVSTGRCRSPSWGRPSSKLFVRMFAWLATVVFLDLNGLDPALTDSEAFDLVGR